MTDIECIKKAQDGDIFARDKIFEENTGLIYMTIKRFAGRGYDSEELFQIGSIGLLKSIEKFDTKSGYAFSTYAVPMIIGEIRRFMRDDSMIHISRKIKEDARKIAIVREQEQKTNNKTLTVDELVKLTGLSKDAIVLATEAYTPVESIAEYMPAAAVEDKESVLDQMVVRQLLDSLEEDDRRLIILRYVYEKTQTQTAEILGMNQVKVSRREKDILKIMRIRLNML